jgi:hypothetical protein
MFYLLGGILLTTGRPFNAEHFLEVVGDGRLDLVPQILEQEYTFSVIIVHMTQSNRL